MSVASPAFYHVSGVGMTTRNDAEVRWRFVPANRTLHFAERQLDLHLVLELRSDCRIYLACNFLCYFNESYIHSRAVSEMVPPAPDPSTVPTEPPTTPLPNIAIRACLHRQLLVLAQFVTCLVRMREFFAVPNS